MPACKFIPLRNDCLCKEMERLAFLFWQHRLFANTMDVRTGKMEIVSKADKGTTNTSKCKERNTMKIKKWRTAIIDVFVSPLFPN